MIIGGWIGFSEDDVNQAGSAFALPQCKKRELTNHFASSRLTVANRAINYGRGAGVGRGRGVGIALTIGNLNVPTRVNQSTSSVAG
jgi:hypothetical protein